MVKTVNERRTKIVSRTLSGGAGHCPTGGLWKLKTEGPTLSGSSRTLSDWKSLENTIFSQNLSLSSQSLILEL
jgi:hypothetical protein